MSGWFAGEAMCWAKWDTVPSAPITPRDRGPWDSLHSTFLGGRAHSLLPGLITWITPTSVQSFDLSILTPLFHGLACTNPFDFLYMSVMREGSGWLHCRELLEACSVPLQAMPGNSAVTLSYRDH